MNAVSPSSILFEGGSWAHRREAEPGGLRGVGASASSRSGGLGTPKEVADVAAFLLSARASWISGANVVVDGAQNQPGMGGVSRGAERRSYPASRRLDPVARW